MSLNNNSNIMATSAAAPPSLLTQVGMAGTAAVLTVTCIHPIDVIKVRMLLLLQQQRRMLDFLVIVEFAFSRLGATACFGFRTRTRSNLATTKKSSDALAVLWAESRVVCR